MTIDQVAQQLHVRGVDHRLEIHARLVAAFLREITFLVEYVRDSAAHTRGKVAAGFSEHNHESFGHVFAPVVADTFDDGGGPGVAYREALARHSVEVSLAAGCTVENHVANQDALRRQECGRAWRIDYELATGKTFAGVIVGIAFQR